MKLSFTTLSCPEWEWDKILNEAVRLGYDGIEIRGLKGEMYLPKLPPFAPENINTTLNQLKEKNLRIVCLDTSCIFHDERKFEDSIEEGKATIDLAQKLEVPFIRVFGDKIPDREHKNKTIRQVARGLSELAEYAKGKDVCVLIETHGDFAASDNLLEVLSIVDKSKPIGVLWDINNPYVQFKESIHQTYKKLAPYIKHIHLKDTKFVNGQEQLCLVGKGDLPIAEALELLKKDGYSGWISFEWEKKWHPEIEEPEIALPAFVEYIKPLL